MFTKTDALPYGRATAPVPLDLGGLRKIEVLRLNQFMLKRIITLFAVALLCGACSKNSSPAGPNDRAAQPSSNFAPRSGGSTQAASQSSAPPAAGELRFKVPEGWTVEKPTADMRFAQYKLPKAAGDSEDALLIVYYFGPGQGGPAQANIDRWVGQIKQPDGQESKDKAKIEALTVNGLHVDTVDVLGNYSGGMSPDSAPADKKAIFRLRGAVIETPKGSYFVKLTGPEKTVGHWDQAYNDYIKSFEFK
jgi:hypothetical protein